MIVMELVKSLNRNIQQSKSKKLGFNSDLKHAIEQACACFGFQKVGLCVLITCTV